MYRLLRAILILGCTSISKLVHHKNYKMLIATILFFILIASMLPVRAETSNKPLVITTTSILGSIVRDIAGGNVDVIILVSPTICPRHYDVRPSDVWSLENADIILYHGFEP